MAFDLTWKHTYTTSCPPWVPYSVRISDVHLGRVSFLYMSDFDAQDYLGMLKRDARGFPYLQFRNHYEKPCSLHLSSIVEPECIWLGLIDPEPRIMKKDAAAHGIETDGGGGWVEFPIPKEVLLSTQMHLSREQVEALIPVLQRWVETGELMV